MCVLETVMPVTLPWEALYAAADRQSPAPRRRRADPGRARGTAAPGGPSRGLPRGSPVVRVAAQLEQRCRFRDRRPGRVPAAFPVSQDAARWHRLVRLLLPQCALRCERTLLGDQRRRRVPVHRARAEQLSSVRGRRPNIAHASAGPSGGTSVSETKAGLNLLGGTTFKLKGSSLVPFAEARGEVGGGKTFILTGGVRF